MQIGEWSCIQLCVICRKKAAVNIKPIRRVYFHSGSGTEKSKHRDNFCSCSLRNSPTSLASPEEKQFSPPLCTLANILLRSPQITNLHAPVSDVKDRWQFSFRRD